MLFLIAAAWLVWRVAGAYDRWTGAARFERTDDAFIAGDVTPLSARVAGHVESVAVDDYQTVHKGDLIAGIDGTDLAAVAKQAAVLSFIDGFLAGAAGAFVCLLLTALLPPRAASNS